MIETQDRSPISFTVGDNVTVLTNTNVTIHCPTTGVPKPTVTWTKDGQEILNGDKYTMQVNGSLLINEVDEKDSARYTCTADSAAGKDSATSTVQVVGKIVQYILLHSPFPKPTSCSWHLSEKLNNLL